MKKILFSVLIIMAVITACSKKTSTSADSAIIKATLPQAAVSYIDNNYPDATIDFFVTLRNSAATYLVTLNTTEELAFSKAGDFMGDGRNFHGGNPGDTTFCGDTTHGGGPGGDGHHGGGHPGGGHHGHGIPVDSLPAAIISYVNANYPGDTIRHAEYDSLCLNGLVIAVMIPQPGMVPPLKLYFDVNGGYLMLANRIHYADVPQAVKDYITTNYADYMVCHGTEKYTLANNSIEYIIYLHKDHLRKSVRLKADGTLICER